MFRRDLNAYSEFPHSVFALELRDSRRAKNAMTVNRCNEMPRTFNFGFSLIKTAV